MNKAFGADFGANDGTMGNRAFSMGGMFDWTANEALTDNNLKVRQAYWLYLGDTAFGADIPWTFSLGRRPSTNGFLANLSQDDAAQSPLGHVINVEFDGLSSKLDLSNVTGVPGMSFKLCMGIGSTNATPLFTDSTPYAEDTTDNISDIKLAGFIFEPYNDGQYIVKTTYYKAYDLVDMNLDGMGNPTGSMAQVGDIEAAAISVLIDGITEEGYFADAKLFGSFAWTKTNPNGEGVSSPDGFGGTVNSVGMLGSTESETGTSYWFGAYLPVGEGSEYGTVGLEYNHGSQYWRPFTYAEDTMIGSKIAVRGDAWEANYTYQIGSMKIDDVKAGAGAWDQMANGGSTQDPNTVYAVASQLSQMAGNTTPVNPSPEDPFMQMASGMAMAKGMSAQIVEKAQDFRLYLRYRF